MSEAARQAEIAGEQQHVDRVYARLETLRAEAERNQREGYRVAPEASRPRAHRPYGMFPSGKAPGSCAQSPKRIRH